MTHYLVVFDRSKGATVLQREFADRNEAISARFAEERRHAAEPDIEVVVLSARSREDILRTHGRYFKGIRELTAD